MKNTPGDIIILHLCTKSNNHMIYDSWDMERNRQNCLSFWAIFCHFTSLTTWKIKIWKNEKSIWRCHHFTNVYQKPWSYDVWFNGQSFLSFRAIFCPLTPLTTWKIKILNKWRDGEQQTEPFVILEYILTFYTPHHHHHPHSPPLATWKITIQKKWK